MKVRLRMVGMIVPAARVPLSMVVKAIPTTAKGGTK
jgi:hypothetical protein